MIDEYWTFRLYGYHSDELLPKSGKPVVVVCEECGRYRVVTKKDYHDLCKSCVKMGGTHTPEARQKMSEKASVRCGDKASNWKGGVTEWRKMLRNTPAYKNWRTAVFERDDYTCQMCDARGGYLEAHHIRPVRDHKNDLVMWDIDNGITLCNGCHDTTKGREADFIDEFSMLVGE